MVALEVGVASTAGLSTPGSPELLAFQSEFQDGMGALLNVPSSQVQIDTVTVFNTGGRHRRLLQAGAVEVDFRIVPVTGVEGAAAAGVSAQVGCSPLHLANATALLDFGLS